jgi:AcrR family transcriptional regulator
MPSRTLHTTDAILDAACQAVVTHGREATIAEVGRTTGIPTGSIYHRFESRHELFVELWLRSIQRLHSALAAAATAVADPNEALLTIAVEMVRYCRTHPAEALAMTLYRQQALLDAGPPRLSGDVASLNAGFFTLLATLADRRFPDGTQGALPAPQLAEVAIVQLPYGLVRPHVGATVPDWLDDIVRASADSVLRLGDRTA